MSREPMNDAEQELANCYYVKSILMIIVVLTHCLSIYDMGGQWGPYEATDQAPFLGLIATWFGTFHVYSFTLISGYIFYYVKYERGGYRRYVPFLKNKVKRLLVPYVFMALIWVVPTYLYFWGNEGIISKYVLGINPSQLWFLLMLFWVFALFWWITDFSNLHPVTGFAIVCVCYLLGKILSAVSVPNLYMIETGLQYIIYFYLGFLIRKYSSRFIMQISSFVYVVVDAAMFIMSFYLQTKSTLIFRVALLGVEFLLNVVGAVMAFVIIQRLVNALGQDNKILNCLSKYSMPIYLFHQQLIYFTIKWFNGIASPIVLVTINFAFALGISTLFAWLMFKTKVTRFLIGS